MMHATTTPGDRRMTTLELFREWPALALIGFGTLGWLGWLAKMVIRGATSVNLWRKRRARERATA
jgi:hypothetical protein